MPNLFGIISAEEKKQEPIEKKALNFSALEMITKDLTDELNDAQMELVTKSEFVNERQRQIVQNNKDLETVAAQMEILSAKIDILEEDEKVHEENMRFLNQKICKLQHLLSDEYLLTKIMESSSTERNLMGEELVELDVRCKELEVLQEQAIAEQEACTRQEKCSPQLLTAILNCHLRALELCEQNMNILSRKSADVQYSLQQAEAAICQQKQQEQKSTNNCHCQTKMD